MQQKTGTNRESFSKNTFYRFLNGQKTNWLRFTTLRSKAVVDAVEPLTDEKRVNAFVIDDSLVWQEVSQTIYRRACDGRRAYVDHEGCHGGFHRDEAV